MTNNAGWKRSDAASSHHEELEPLVAVEYRVLYDPDLENSHESGKYNAFLRRAKQWRFQHREFLAEFIGTFILVLLIDGVAAEQTLFGTKSWLTSSFGTGLAVLSGICLSGHISGGHINPAVTLAFWAFSGFPSRKVLVYITAQIAGAFTAAAVLYSVIIPAITEFDGGVRQTEGPQATAGIFATYSPLYVGTGAAIASEVVGTALLLLIIMSSGHPNNVPFVTSQGFVIGIGVMIICLSIGYTSGFSLNPARDIGPRLFTAIAGWGLDVFTVHNYYSLIPIFAPLLGAMLGALTFVIFVDQ
ncbi:aquaporin-like protein [Phycomyces nitens]|nr:aquaporin-like protein [Phycomyces nitens]